MHVQSCCFAFSRLFSLPSLSSFQGPVLQPRSQALSLGLRMARKTLGTETRLPLIFKLQAVV